MSNDFDEPTPDVFIRAKNWVLKYPGFFKPYQDWEDFLFTVASPIIAPVAFTITSVECLVLAVLAELLAVPVAVMATLLGAVFSSPDWGKDTFDYMTSLGRDIFIASITYLGLALLSIVGSPIGLVTRTISSIIDGVANLCAPDNSSTSNLELSPTI